MADKIDVYPTGVAMTAIIGGASVNLIQRAYVTSQALTASLGGATVTTSCRVAVSGMELQAQLGPAQAIIGKYVCVTAAPMQAHVGTPSFSLDCLFEVTGNEMTAHTSLVEISGQLVTREFAYPFQGIHYTSPGMTLRQYYVGQAITGFLSSGGPIANLIGKGAELCFRVADSMIAYEAKMAGPPPMVRTPPVPAPPSNISAPPGQANPSVPPEEVAAMQEQEKASLN